MDSARALLRLLLACAAVRSGHGQSSPPPPRPPPLPPRPPSPPSPPPPVNYAGTPSLAYGKPVIASSYYSWSGLASGSWTGLKSFPTRCSVGPGRLWSWAASSSSPLSWRSWHPAAPRRSTVGVLVAFCMLLLFQRHRPYSAPGMNFVASVAQVNLYFFLFVGLLLKVRLNGDATDSKLFNALVGLLSVVPVALPMLLKATSFVGALDGDDLDDAGEGAGAGDE